MKSFGFDYRALAFSLRLQSTAYYYWPENRLVLKGDKPEHAKAPKVSIGK